MKTMSERLMSKSIMLSAIRRAKVKQLLNLIQGRKIKGMKTIISEVKIFFCKDTLF